MNKAYSDKEDLKEDLQKLLNDKVLPAERLMVAMWYVEDGVIHYTGKSTWAFRHADFLKCLSMLASDMTDEIDQQSQQPKPLALASFLGAGAEAGEEEKERAAAPQGPTEINAEEGE